MTTVSQEAREAEVTITHTDRVAAWPYAGFHCLPDRQMRERWFSGYYDDLEQGHAIRDFARHRQSAERGGVVAWQDVITERRRQIEKEGWSFEHDDAHEWGQMAGAAVCYALTNVGHWAAGPAIDQFWPWDKAWWKPTDKRRNLVKAAALLLAEIERIDRSRHLSKPEEA